MQKLAILLCYQSKSKHSFASETVAINHSFPAVTIQKLYTQFLEKNPNEIPEIIVTG